MQVERLTRLLKKLLPLLAPEAVLLLATIVAVRLDALQDSLPGFAHFYPYAVFIVGGLLAWRFQRARLLFALLVLALATVGVRAPTGGAAARTAASVVFRATALLLPLNLALLALLADRGVRTRAAQLRFGAIVLQCVVILVLRHTAPATTAAVLGHALLPATWFRWTQLNQAALVAFAVALGVTGAPLLFERNASTRGFLWAIVASLLAVSAPLRSPAPLIYLGTAALILVVAVIEASYLLAYQDGLTELPARRALTEALQRLAGDYAVAMVDVDHFKKFNDQFGHDVGDQVLRMVATKLGEVEGGGRAFRYGGEEFAIIFPGKAVEDALPHLEAVREAVGATTFTIRRRIRHKRAESKAARRRSIHVSITVSIGVAQRSARYSVPDQVVRAADQALYRAKEDGRNRVRS